MKQNVAILGASPKPDRYAHMAQRLLLEKGHRVYPVSPRYDNVDELPCFKSLNDIQDQVDTLTLYVNAEISSSMIQEILSLKPKRVIFNPGSENPVIMKSLMEANIESIEACTLVLIRLGNF